MRNLLIVDDFFYDREYAKDVINWSNLGINIVGAAEDGEQALEMVSTFQPDIILTDIAMPEMDGLELTTQLRDDYPHVKVIFMSCHSEFEYAKYALKLNVYDYLTKPLIKKDVENVINRLSIQMDLEEEKKKQRADVERKLEKSLPLVRERLLRNLFIGTKDIQDIIHQMNDLGIEMAGNTYQLILIEIDEVKKIKRQFDARDRQIMILDILDIVKQSQKACAYGETMKPVQIDDTHCVLILNYRTRTYSSSPDSPGHKFAKDIWYRLINSTLPLMTMVIGNIFYDVERVPSEYEKTRTAAKYKFFKGKGQLIQVDLINQDEKGIHNKDLNELQQDIKAVLFAEDENIVRNFLPNYFNGFNEQSQPEYVLNNIMGLCVCVQFVLHEFGFRFEDIFGKERTIWDELSHLRTFQEVKSWTNNLLRSIQTWLIENKTKRDSKIVQEVRDYVTENYNSELTVEKIAQKIDIYYSTNYLNHLYRKETNETIPDFIVTTRIEKAKEFLQQTDLKLYEIVEKVGYKHAPYFNALFKKKTGMTPREYRKQIGVS